MSNEATVIISESGHPNSIRMPQGGPKVVFVTDLPDWTLLFVDYAGQEELALIRKALWAQEMKIVRVTDERIYFEEAF